ncbi:MAG: haloacid dehalogenase type II [Polaromonas sp.]|uniref:haloacid dehalogenase type II n=1 Tax=Polaromonas sp. TaxID=1869339 RepID=UPI0018512DB7|nr:haloacid dehalogenase type II [Polaromonas sp.]NMM11689.1 haloacid dehalogenase type II [Polaromonas sp.]
MSAEKESPVASQTEGLKVLFFDVQGTLVDFYSTIVQEGGKFSRLHGFQADWSLITEQWRAEYRNQLDQVIKQERPWTTTDAIYRDALDRVLTEHSWGNSLSPTDRDELSSVWSKLIPWNDSAQGLERLRARYTTSTLSNGSMASVLRITKHGGLPFDAILTAELIKSSKPDPKVYQMALDSVGIKAHQAMMVACHKYDLSAAKKLGFKVAFIARPLEFGPTNAADTKAEPYFDFYANSVNELASILGA